MKRKTGWTRTLASPLVTLAAWLLVDASGVPEAHAQEGDNTFVIAAESNADILDPHAAGGWVTYRVLYQMYEGLLGRDLTKTYEPGETPDILPKLATNYTPSDDYKVWTFKLRPGVQFHDGTAFDADAVVFNVRRASDETFEHYSPRAASMSSYSYRYPQLQSVEAVDDMTVRFTFGRGFPDLPWTWTEVGMGMPWFISPDAVREFGNDEIANHPTGTGPFKFVRRVRGDRIVLERNDDYWGDESTKPWTAAQLDQFVYLEMPDTTARMTALQTGTVDAVVYPLPDLVDPMEQQGYQLSAGPVGHRWFIYVNMQNPKMQNLDLRRALYMAVDRESLATNLLQDLAVPAYGYVIPGSEAYSADFRPEWFTGYDPERAKELVEEAGATGVEVTIRGPSEGSGMIQPVEMMQWIARDFAKIGINANVEQYEWITFLNLWNKGIEEGVELQVMGSGDAPPPYEIWHSDWWGPTGHNTGYFKNAEVDQLLDQAYEEPDKEQRIGMIRKAHEIYIDQVAVIPIVHDTFPILLAPNVQGFVHAPVEWFDLRTVTTQ